MRPIIHIGPPKTASTSLQNGVIPKLGRPIQIKPPWVKELCRLPTFEGPTLAADVILSDEMLGDFAFFSPDVIAQRLASVAEDGIIIYVQREPVDLFYSYYRQALRNGVGVQATTLRKFGVMDPPLSIDEYFDSCREKYRQEKNGFFAAINTNQVALAFSRFFDFEMLDFELIKQDPASFASSFAIICGCHARFEFPHDNQGDEGLLRDALANNDIVPPFFRAMTTKFHQDPQLSRDRADLLRAWSRQAHSISA